MLTLFNFFFFCSSFASQLNHLTNRLDHLEHSLKKDMRTILDILHQQQQINFQQHHHQQQQQQQQQGAGTSGGNGGGVAGVKQTQVGHIGVSGASAKSYQPSESEMSFELATGGPMSGQSSVQQRNVHRSVSQPETANEKGLLR